MGDDLPGFRLRELSPDDGPAIGRLFDASPDSGMIRFRPSFQVDPYVALTYDERGPFGRIVRPPRWLPRTSFSIALRAPDAANELRPGHPIEPVQ